MKNPAITQMTDNELKQCAGEIIAYRFDNVNKFHILKKVAEFYPGDYAVQMAENAILYEIALRFSKQV